MTYGRAHDRKKRRQTEAKERNEAYAKLTLDEKISQQLSFAVASQRTGKQLRKLEALKQK